MRRGRPSGTSSLVTMLRALGHEGVTEVRDFQDPTALAMLPPAWRLATQLVVRRMAAHPRSRERLLADGRFDLVALRTRALDAAWGAAHARGTRQLVLLGAGLDGRAFRLPDVGDTTVFEVDHPATQALKRERSAALTPRAQRRVLVPVDFERDRLSDALQAAGQDRAPPTFWIWEGVTPYLTPAAQQQTLAAVAERSAPGSQLAMTYVEPAAGVRFAGTRLLVGRVFGEPFIGLLTRAAAAELLRSAGFTVAEDSGCVEWQRRYTQRPGREASFVPERIAIADRSV